MSNVKLIEKVPAIDGMPVGDIIHLAHYNWRGLPEWVIRCHNDGRLVITNETVTVETAEGLYVVDFRWWVIMHPRTGLQAIREDVLWEKYDKVEEQ